MVLLKYLGYLINSIILMFLFALGLKMFCYTKKKEISTFPMGAFLDSLTIFIINQVKIIFPMRGEVGSNLTTSVVLIVIFVLIRKFMI